jgi:hypothetical protein
LIEDEKIPDVLDLYFKEFDIYSKFNIKNNLLFTKAGLLVGVFIQSDYKVNRME